MRSLFFKLYRTFWIWYVKRQLRKIIEKEGVESFQIALKKLGYVLDREAGSMTEMVYKHPCGAEFSIQTYCTHQLN